MRRRIKTTAALALAIGASTAPPALALPAELTQPSTAPQPRPSTQIVRVDAPGGFDWGDAGIGAAAGLGLSMLAIGGGLLISGGRRARTSGMKPVTAKAQR
jgi:hypothetical protein